jgi:hypothetical protein
VTLNGSSPQTIGNSFSTTFNNLTISNGSGVSNTVDLTVTGLLTVQTGPFTFAGTLTGNNVQINNTGTLTLNAGATINITGNWTNNGTFSPASNALVAFNGSSNQSIGGSNSTPFARLTINNSAGVTLGVDNSVTNTLTLTSGDLNTGSFTLTMPSAAGSAGTTDVVGNLKRTGAPLPNSALTYGNPDNVITLAGSTLTSLTVNLTKSVPTSTITGIPNSGWPAAVQRTYIITEVPGGAFTPAGTTLQLHYLTTELNGNSEATLGPPASLRLYRYVVNNPGTGWQQQDVPSGNNTSLSANHFVKVVGIKGFSPWTMANSSPTAAPASIGGMITDASGAPISGATINLSGAESRETITDANGNYSFDNVTANGFYTVTPSRVNYAFSPPKSQFQLVGRAHRSVIHGCGQRRSLKRHRHD